MRYYIWLVLFLASSMALAQSYQTGSVVSWEIRPYSQSAHIVRDHVVYSVRVGEVGYQIARRSHKVEMTAGQKIDCRVEKSQIFVRGVKGKETKYEIVGAH